MRDLGVTSDQALDRIAAQRRAARRRKKRITGLPVALAQPGGEHADHVPLERRAALLAAFALAAQMRAGPQHDVTTSQVNELGHPQSGLDGE